MGATERWVEEREGKFFLVCENDGPRFLRRGPERWEAEITKVENHGHGWYVKTDKSGVSYGVSAEDGERIATSVIGEAK